MYAVPIIELNQQFDGLSHGHICRINNRHFKHRPVPTCLGYDPDAEFIVLDTIFSDLV